MTWLRAHWLAVVLGVAVGAPLAWLVKPDPQPAIQYKDRVVFREQEHKAEAEKENRAPVRVVTRTVTTSGPGCAGPSVEQTVTEDRGAVEIERNATDDRATAADRQVDLRITPAPLPRWALGAGLEDPLGARRVSLIAGMRLLGPVWLRAGATPARGLSGVSVGAEVQW